MICEQCGVVCGWDNLWETSCGCTLCRWCRVCDLCEACDQHCHCIEEGRRK